MKEVGSYFAAVGLSSYVRADVEKALKATRDRERSNPADGEVWYVLAQYYSLLGYPEDCVRALRRAVEMGFFCYPYMLRDSFLDGVREDPEVQRVFELAKIRHDKFRSKRLAASSSQ